MDGISRSNCRSRCPKPFLGAKVEAPTLDGFKTLTIPPGTSSGQKLRLKGQGVPASKSLPAGDLYIVPKIVVPRSIDEESRRLIEEFAKRQPTNPREGPLVRERGLPADAMNPSIMPRGPGCSPSPHRPRRFDPCFDSKGEV